MNRRAPCLMIQGTGSGVGKSVLATAFCRLFARAGYRVAPFKSQNMSLNSAVTADGGEIGRAQAAQAEAAGVEATVDMNPILLKPESDARSQVVVRGRPAASVTFDEYERMTPALLDLVRESLERLRHAHDVVVVEGAGSPAEINLRDGDIVNMRIARLADAPVLLVGDIDRGGVFASLLGTVTLLEAADRARVAGFVVNKLRGNAALLTRGFAELSARTGVPVLGVVPYIAESLVPAEDSVNLQALERENGPVVLEVAVARLPHIANFDDLEPLAREPGVRVRFVSRPQQIEDADLIVLPGSKSTAADLTWLRAVGLADAVVAAASLGRPVVGICGGYQMLGLAVHDPDAVESSAPTTAGLGLLPVVTVLQRDKTTVRVRGRVGVDAGPFARAAGADVQAYEIHVGRTEVRTARRPFLIVARRDDWIVEPEGALNDAGNVVGTYLHGLLANDALRRALLLDLAARRGVSADPRWGKSTSAIARYDRLADVVGAGCDLGVIGKLVGLDLTRRA